MKYNIEYIRQDIPAFDIPPYRGQRYEDLVPHTFDLAERMALAVNGLTGPTDPDRDYEMYFRMATTPIPPVMWHDGGDHCQAKFMEALPLMRIGSGSDLNLHVERRWMEVWLHSLGPDGLWYWATRPWPGGDCDLQEPVNGDAKAGQYAEPCINGASLRALTAYARRDPDGPWREACKRMVDGLWSLTIDRGDWAYIPEGSFTPNAPRPQDAPVPLGIMSMFSAGFIPQGLTLYFNAFGYEPALTLAGKLARYLVHHGLYFDPDGRFLPDEPAEGARSGADYGAAVPDMKTGPHRARAHFHGHTLCLLSVLEYALAAGDTDLMRFVDRSYCWARGQGYPLIGYFPENVYTSRQEAGEICETADMIALAVKLSAAGIGDHWDDVERYLRNHFAECQLTRPHLFDLQPERLISQTMPTTTRFPVMPPTDHTQTRYGKAGLPWTTDRVIERNTGAFAGYAMVNDWGAGIMHCCTGNGTRALYYAWEHALFNADGALSVNLLMNRASAEADVYSHLPYGGQVDVKVKAETGLRVRIPDWVEPKDVACRVNGQGRGVGWDRCYALVGRVAAGDEVSLRFPLAERKLSDLWIEKTRYTVVTRGYEVVEMDPPGRMYPLYGRDHYRQDSTLWKKVTRFVSEEGIRW